jgi:DNA-binding transcriptional MerR regulator
MLLRIGEFSKLSGIPIRTLRYYDEIDLFKPAEIDLFTDYRYYKEEQLEDLELINRLKSVGFTLEEIKESWNNFSDEIMIKKKKELLEKLDDINKSIKEIDYMRSNIVDGKIVKKLPTSKGKVKTLY